VAQVTQVKRRLVGTKTSLPRSFTDRTLGPTALARPGMRPEHPTVRTGDQFSLGERAADKMPEWGGVVSSCFVYFGVMVIWAVVNGVLHVGGGSGFDPYPSILLNLFLSMLAGIQAAALMIAAKRVDASEVALHTENCTDDIKTLLAKNTALTARVKEPTV
jgi:uncharacterized membrane protein